MIFQISPEIKWSIVEIDHVKPNYLFDVSKDEEMKKAFNWKNIQPLSIQFHQQNGTIFDFLLHRLQFIKAYQFRIVIEDNLTEIFNNETFSKSPRKHYPTNRITYNHFDGIWSIDLMVMSG